MCVNSCPCKQERYGVMSSKMTAKETEDDVLPSCSSSQVTIVAPNKGESKGSAQQVCKKTNRKTVSYQRQKMKRINFESILKWVSKKPPRLFFLARFSNFTAIENPKTVALTQTQTSHTNWTTTQQQRQQRNVASSNHKEDNEASSSRQNEHNYQREH